jgi:hypothetical protein
MHWERLLMGLRSSPYNCVKIYLWSEEIIRGDRHDPQNGFQWDEVKLNLPGEKTYDPRKPWVYRFDTSRRQLAAFVISYVDDLRTGAQSKELCEKVMHTVGSRANYLGEQDATRKRGEASQCPGAWAGSVIVSKEGEGLFVTILQEKWDKVRNIVDKYKQLCVQTKEEEKKGVLPMLDYKQLERDTGFLVHVFMTYENVRPYLKGFYLTLNGWRHDRKDSGWKRNRRDWETMADEEWGDYKRWKEAKDVQKARDEERGLHAPTEVRAVGRWVADVEMLSGLFQGKTPSMRLIRGYSLARVLYGFGDASRAGFGASWVEQTCAQSGNAVRYRFGWWGKEGMDKSSNFRELRNLLDTLETMGANGELLGVEVFLFTDNATAEAAYGRGSSSSEGLFLMVKHLKLMEMLYQSRIHVIHVAGKRMIVQGTDGLSRGSLQDGVMQGDDMLEVLSPCIRTRWSGQVSYPNGYACTWRLKRKRAWSSWILKGGTKGVMTS